MNMNMNMDSRGLIFCKDIGPMLEMINSNSRFVISRLNLLHGSLGCVAVGGIAMGIFTHFAISKLKERIYNLERRVDELEEEKENC